MARPAGKISFAAGIVITIVCLLWVCVLMFRIDFTPIKVSVGSDKIEITSGYSDMEIDIDEVQSAELLPSYLLIVKKRARQRNGMRRLYKKKTECTLDF